MDSLVKRAIATMFVAFLVLFAFTNAWGQATGTSQPQIARIRTLQIDAWARPGVGQFAPADDLAQYLVYVLYVTNWKVRIRVSSLVGEVRPLPPSFVRLKTDEGHALKSGEGGASPLLNRIDGDVVVRRH